MSHSSSSNSSGDLRALASTPTAVNSVLSLANTEIIDVWEYNFEAELYRIMDLIEQYNVVALDTEFPGVVKSPIGVKDEREYEYRIIEENVNVMKVIQIGISIANERGEVPLPVSTWQFNFKFDLSTEPNLSEAIKLLKNSGINFELFKENGIPYGKFSEFFISSGIVLNENIKWISFHGGFDFGYLLKLLINDNLPGSLEQFAHLLNIYFPTFYDLKYQIQDFDSIRYDGLSRLGDDIEIRRIGPQHQAGSDSLLTLACFFKLKESYYKNEGSFLIRSHNILFGLGKGFCENYNYNHNRNNNNNNNNSGIPQRDYNEISMIFPSIYNTGLYNLKEYMPYNYSYGSFMGLNNGQYSNFGGNVLQNLVTDLNLQNLNLHQIYNNVNSRNGKNGKK